MSNILSVLPSRLLKSRVVARLAADLFPAAPSLVDESSRDLLLRAYRHYALEQLRDARPPLFHFQISRQGKCSVYFEKLDETHARQVKKYLHHHFACSDVHIKYSDMSIVQSPDETKIVFNFPDKFAAPLDQILQDLDMTAEIADPDKRRRDITKGLKKGLYPESYAGPGS